MGLFSCLRPLCPAAALLALGAAAQAGEAPPVTPAPAPLFERWEVAEETGVLFGVNNPNDYVSAPQIFSLRYQYKPTEPFFSTPLTFRDQFTFSIVATPFITGAENYYFGLAVGKRFTFSRPGSRFGLYMDGRFAVGTIDSHGPPYGQGQDLTFNAIATVGVVYQISEHARFGLGFMYEHFSNGGFSEPEAPNVGLDTMGPSMSLQVTF